MPNLPRNKKKAVKDERKGRKQVEGAAILKTAAWIRVSKSQRQREPLCELCLLDSVLTPATQVDHIIPRPIGSNYDQRNLQSLCHRCHGMKSSIDKSVTIRSIATVHGLVPQSKEDALQTIYGATKGRWLASVISDEA